MIHLADKPRYLQAPRVARSAVNLLWHCNYYDGPLQGVCELKGERLWFDTIEEEIPDQEEVFLFRLPDSEMKKLEAEQELRERIVGRGNRYDALRGEDCAGVEPESISASGRRAAAFEEYIEAAKKLPPANTRSEDVVAWFAWRDDGDRSPSSPSIQPR
jgi:hypothetical protein